MAAADAAAAAADADAAAAALTAVPEKAPSEKAPSEKAARKAVAGRATKAPVAPPPPSDDAAGEDEGISCDACDVDCFAESHLCGDEDICPACYRKPEGAYPADAEHQREGVAVPVNEKAVSEEDGGGKKAKQ